MKTKYKKINDILALNDEEVLQEFEMVELKGGLDHTGKKCSNAGKICTLVGNKCIGAGDNCKPLTGNTCHGAGSSCYIIPKSNN